MGQNVREVLRGDTMRLTGPQLGLIADALAEHIIATVADPADWKKSLRREAERMGLRLARINFDGALCHASFAVIEEAHLQSVPESTMRQFCGGP